MSRRSELRRRFWIQTVLASVTCLLTVVTAVSREWIEIVFGVDPDNGSGALEWAIVGLLAAVSVTCALVARFEWRHVTMVSKTVEAEYPAAEI